MAQNNLIERVKFSFSRVSSLCHVGFIKLFVLLILKLTF